MFFLSFLLAACGGGGAQPDPDGGGSGMDAGARDAAVTPDAGAALDARPDAAAEPCDAPGMTESVACGSCGTVSRFCTSERVWAYGECEGEGLCVPGSERSTTCGDCGTQLERCSAECAWQPSGECSDQGVCAPGTRSRDGTGCGAGETRPVVCSGACAFEPAGACEPDACATPGARETVPCGNCGSTVRFCTANHVWTYDVCTGEGECAPGTIDATACGNCGTRPAWCTTECRWEAMGECTGEGACTAGTMTRTGEGCPAGQSRVVACNDACMPEAGACEPDECTPGATTTAACGRCGVMTRTCTEARRWSDGPCREEGECMPGATGSQACGACGMQATRCNTSCEWETASSCTAEGECAPGASRSCATECDSTGTQVCSDACGWGECVVPSESCNGVDDDCDRTIDEGCPTGCSLPGDTCGATQICACPGGAASCAGTGQCVALFGTYDIEISSGRLPPEDPLGDCWDIPCGPPDPFIDLYIGGTRVGTTPSRADTRTPVWPPQVFRASLANGSAVLFDVFDEDITFHDFAFDCTITVSAAALRARTFECTAGTDEVVRGAFVRRP